MARFFGRVDVLLRAHGAAEDGSAQSGAAQGGPAQGGPVGAASLSRWGVLGAIVVLAGLYGFFMGWYALRVHGAQGLTQMVSSTVKVPLLYLLTLSVTFPSLYVLSTLSGSSLGFRRSLRTLGEWVVVMAAVSASLGPILGFFTLSTESYPFIVLLNVVLMTVSGFAGCAALARRLERAAPVDTEGPGPGAATRRRGFWVWVAVFGAVGLQMAWVMRPFVGAPDAPFELFRPTDSNAYEALGRVLLAVFKE